MVLVLPGAPALSSGMEGQLLGMGFGSVLSLAEVHISKILLSEKDTSLVDRRNCLSTDWEGNGGTGIETERRYSNPVDVLAIHLLLCGIPFVLFSCNWQKPLASPCAVCEKVGFEVSHAVSTVVEVRAGLAECKGLPDGAVGFSLQWFCLAREMPSRTRDMNWMLESYWWNICGPDVRRGGEDSAGLWPALNRVRRLHFNQAVGVREGLPRGTTRMTLFGERTSQCGCYSSELFLGMTNAEGPLFCWEPNRDRGEGLASSFFGVSSCSISFANGSGERCTQWELIQLVGHKVVRGISLCVPAWGVVYYYKKKPQTVSAVSPY